MSKDKQHKNGNWFFVCESCFEGLETDERDLDLAWEIAREEGWKYMGADEHLCPGCGAEQ